MESVGLTHFLIVSAILFSLGVLCVMTRKNAILEIGRAHV